MSRAGRLLDLVQILRRHRRPVSGAYLAEETGVSLRTLYRDIASLQAQGAPIEGEAGLGYVLKPGFTLPPLMFTREELDALALGAQFVVARSDAALAQAAQNALAKIDAVLPAPTDAPDEIGLSAYKGRAPSPHLAALRAALRAEKKIAFAYRDKKGRATRRIVWPIMIGFFEGLEMLAAFCELRGEFRHFRLDRMTGVEALGARTPRRRAVLLREWRLAEGILEDSGADVATDKN